MKLWAMRQAGILAQYGFDLDLHAEVFESCAYHRWGLFENPVGSLATLVLGGGVPKNFNLQPEPALSQILGLPNVRGYEFDVQIVSSPVTDGSLSSCFPAEAVTWGKVDKNTYLKSTESLQADYSMVMPFLVKALLDNRARYQAKAQEIGEEKLWAAEPEAKGYLRPVDGYRLFEHRERLCATLLQDVSRTEPGVAIECVTAPQKHKRPDRRDARPAARTAKRLLHKELIRAVVPALQRRTFVGIGLRRATVAAAAVIDRTAAGIGIAAQLRTIGIFRVIDLAVILQRI